MSNENGLENFSSVCSSLSLERQFAVLRWVRQLPLFRGIFDRQIRFERGEDLEPLIKWMADFYLSSDLALDQLWSDLGRFGTAINHEFYSHLRVAAYRAFLNGNHEADLVLKFLHTSVPGISAPEPTGSMPFEWGVKRSVAASEIRRLLYPRITPVMPSGTESFSKYSFLLKWGTNGYHLRSVLEQSDPDPQSPLFQAIERALLDAYDLAEEFDLGLRYDAVAGGVIDLELPTDRVADPITAAARYLAGACSSGKVTEAHRLRWWDTRRPLFRRLSLVALKHERTASPRVKIGWALKNLDDFHDASTRSELLILLAQNIREAPDSCRHAVLVRILESADSDLDSYRYLKLLTNQTGDWREAEEEIERLETTSSVVQAEAARNDDAAEKLHSLQPLEAVSGLSKFLAQFPEGGWKQSEQLESGIGTFLAENPASSIELALRATDCTEVGAETALRISIQAIQPESVIEASGQFLELCRRASDFDPTSLSLLLSKAGRLASTNQAQVDIVEAVNVLWARNVENYELTDLKQTPDILQWPELLIEAISGLAYAKWKFTETTKMQVADWFGAEIGSRLQERQLEPLVARALCRRLGFISQLNETFTLETVVPLFFEPFTEKFAWTGYLQNPQLSRSEPLKGIVKKLLIEGWRPTITDDFLRHRFFEVMAVTIENQLYREDDLWEILGNGIACLSDAERALLIQFLGTRLDSDTGELLWQHGVQEFVKRRLSQQPRQVGANELNAIANLPFEAPGIASGLVPELMNALAGKKLPVSDAPSNLFVREWTNQEVEQLAPYLRMRIESAGFNVRAERALLELLMRNAEAGPETRKLIAKLRPDQQGKH